MDHYRPGSIIKVDRKLDKFGTSLCRNKYVAPDVTGVIREITKITKQDAATLVLLWLLRDSSFKAPVIGAEGREATASASNTIPAAKIEIGGDEANPAGFEG
ncbi:unnamed protein product [Brassica oleracea var. botrytis]